MNHCLQKQPSSPHLPLPDYVDSAAVLDEIRAGARLTYHPYHPYHPTTPTPPTSPVTAITAVKSFTPAPPITPITLIAISTGQVRASRQPSPTAEGRSVKAGV